jgi:hypothetical protein
MVAALFMLSAVAHHAMAAAMSAGTGMTAATAGEHTASHDGMPCSPSLQCSDVDVHAIACAAHCAPVMGIIAVPAFVRTMAISYQIKAPVARALASLHGPPDLRPPNHIS